MNPATITPTADLDNIRAEYDLGERHGRHAGRDTAAELLDGPDATHHARQILADLAEGNPDLWLQCPSREHMHSDAYQDGYFSGWAAEIEHQSRLYLSMFIDFETVPH
jgi:hypothetical protein